MAWGRSSPPKPKTTLSTIRQLLPLIIILAILAVAAYIGYQLYLSFAKISEQASERMNKKNMVFTKDGLRVGVKEVKNERYVDQTQSWVVKAWNLGAGSKQDEETKKQPHKLQKKHH